MCKVSFLVRNWINSLSGHNWPVDVNKPRKFFLFKPENIVMKILEATTQIVGFNQRLPCDSPKKSPYSGPQWNEDDAIDTFF